MSLYIKQIRDLEANIRRLHIILREARYVTLKTVHGIAGVDEKEDARKLIQLIEKELEDKIGE